MSANQKDKMAGEFMSKKLLTIGMEAPLTEAYSLMQTRKIRHLPVVSPNGDVIGILSDRDLQRAMSPQYDKDSPREMAFRFDPAFVAKDFMSWPIHKVHVDTLLLTVAKRMLLEKISAFLVESEAGRIEGIITTDDMLRVLIQLLEKDPGRVGMSLKGAWSEFTLPAGNWA